MIEAVMERLQEIKRLSGDSNQSSLARLTRIGKLVDEIFVEIFVEAKSAAKAEKKKAKTGGAEAGDEISSPNQTSANGVVL